LRWQFEEVVSLLKMLDELWDEMDGVGCACETLSFVPPPFCKYSFQGLEDREGDG
jgi:hypothetical protein